MSVGTKVLFILGSMLLFMMVIPLLVIWFFPVWSGMGFFILSFFVTNPILVVCLSLLAGTAIRKMWWTPGLISLLFPLLFAVAIRDFVLDLYMYSAMYFVIGLLSMLAMHFCKK